MKKYILPILSAIMAPVPYPAAGVWQVIVGSTLIWWLRGAPRTYSPGQFLSGIAISLVVGVAAVALINYLNKR